MATKNYSKKSVKALRALLETASEEDKVLIQAELEKKEAMLSGSASQEEDAGNYSTTKVGASTVVTMEPEPLSPEEQAMLDAAEAQAEKDAEDIAKNGHKTTKMEIPDEEIQATIEECKKNVMHKCEILPNGEVDWVEAVIIGVMHDKRSNAIMYRVKDVNGKISHKAYTAKTIRIKDEVVEKAPRVYTQKGEEKPKRSDEEALKLKEEAQLNRGRKVLVTVKKADSEETEKIAGTIKSIMHDTRSNAVMYKIDLENGKSIYKVVTSEAVEMTDEWDEDIKARIAKRAEAEANKIELTPVEKVAKYEAEIEKTEASIVKLQQKLEALKEALAKAKEEVSEAPAEEAPAEEALAEEAPAEESLLD